MSRAITSLLVALLFLHGNGGVELGPVPSGLLERTIGRLDELMRLSASPSAHPRTNSASVHIQHHMTCDEMLDEDGDPDMSIIEEEYDTVGECTAIWGYDIFMGYDCPITDEDHDYNLPFGSCCENSGQCNDGLICSWGDRTCTRPCEGPHDTSGVCESYNTTCYGTGAREECFTCDAETECDPNIAFCRTCKSYVGPVNATYLAFAGCGMINDDSVYGEGQDYHQLCTNRPKCTDPYLELLDHVIEEECIEEWICPELDEDNSLQILDLACSYNDAAQTCFDAITTLDSRSCVGWMGAGCCVFAYYDVLLNQTELSSDLDGAVGYFESVIADCGLVREQCELCDSRWTFSCASGGCIPLGAVCDGVEQCIDGEDEAACTCTASQVRCRSGTCISADLTCNGVNNCPDGFDESAFFCPTCELAGGLDCDGMCIPQELLCDGADDCPNGSDELEFNCIPSGGSSSSTGMDGSTGNDDDNSEDLVEPSSSSTASSASSSTGDGGSDDDNNNTSGAASGVISSLAVLAAVLAALCDF